MPGTVANLVSRFASLQAMNDDKRLLRQLKRDVKRTGNRKRRRYLKDVTADPDGLDFGPIRSDAMNQSRPARSKRPKRPETSLPETAMPEKAIDRFAEEYHFLSNFYYAAITYGGISFDTIEHAFQAQKSKDPAEQREIAAAGSPMAAKRMGRKVKLRRDWESVKVGIMRDLVRLKFTSHPELAKQLLATGNSPLIEGNSWNDNFWGVCSEGGKNWLGRILMEVRDELRILSS
jgi:ribA/ribD-fused uncharacterized protein